MLTFLKNEATTSKIMPQAYAKKAYDRPVQIRLKPDNVVDATLQDPLSTSLPNLNTLHGCPFGLFLFLLLLSYLHPSFFYNVLLACPLRNIWLSQCKSLPSPTLPASARSLTFIDLGHQHYSLHSTLTLQLFTPHACHCTFLSRRF